MSSRIAAAHSQSSTASGASTFTPEQQKTKDAFKAAGDFTKGEEERISDKWTHISKWLPDMTLTDEKEYAMLFANLMQESSSLKDTSERISDKWTHISKWLP